MERFKGACTDWTSYAEINRPNCLILERFAVKQGANRFGRLILATLTLPDYGRVARDAGIKGSPARGCAHECAERFSYRRLLCCRRAEPPGSSGNSVQGCSSSGRPQS